MSTTSYGDYWHNLHLVLVREERWREVDRDRLERTKQVILAASRKKKWLLSQLAILCDHLHLTVGCSFNESPEEVVLSLIDNISWVYEMGAGAAV